MCNEHRRTVELGRISDAFAQYGSAPAADLLMPSAAGTFEVRAA